MGKFQIPENPDFDVILEEIGVERAYPSVFNTPISRLLINDVYLNKNKANKVHRHFIYDINNILLEIQDTAPECIGKYVRITESVLQNIAKTGVYANYQVQIDYLHYFELELYIQQDKVLTEEKPQIELYTIGCPEDVGIYVTVQSDTDWQIYDIDIYIKINKPFSSMRLRQLSQNGDTNVLTHNCYKVIERLEDRANLIEIITATEKNYKHPSSHLASMINVEDSKNQFASDNLEDVLDELFATKADDVLATHEKNGLIAAADKRKLDGVSTGAEVNQNAINNIRVGNTNVYANTKEGQIILVPGSNITISADNATKVITITANIPNKVENANNADRVGGRSFNWAGQGGQPTWIWGANEPGTDSYVWNPANFSVNYANSANTCNRSTNSNWADGATTANAVRGFAFAVAIQAAAPGDGNALWVW